MIALETEKKLVQLKVEEKTESARIGKCYFFDKELTFPAYIPEIKGEEDWKVFHRHMNLLPESWPVMIQSGFLSQFLSSLPQVTIELDAKTALAVRERHFIFYEPMEIYSFKLIRPLLSHSFAGSSSIAGNFSKNVKDRDQNSALSLLPLFERSFIKAVWGHIEGYYAREDSQKVVTKRNEYSKALESVWASIDQEYFAKINSMMFEAPNLASSSFIPPVPLLRSSSPKGLQSQVIRMNRASGFLFSETLKKLPLDGPTKVRIALPWYSLYVDASCFDAKSNDKEQLQYKELMKIVESSFDARWHIGISVTVNRIEDIKKDRASKNQFLSFIESLDDFALSHGVPLFMPRSGYYGMEMLDYGVEFFSSMLSGNLKYSSGGDSGDEKDPTAKYGKTAVYETGDLTFEKLLKYLETNKELPKVGNLPSRLPIGNVIGDMDFRLHFSKPRRIATHVREVKEISDEIRTGRPRAAFNYLTRIQNAGMNQYI